MRLTRLCALLVGVSATTAQAQSLDANVNDESLAMEIHGPLRTGGFSNVRYDLGFIYKDDTRNNTLGAFGLNKRLINDAGWPGLSVGAGGRFYIGDVRSADVGALAPGVLLNYVPAIEKRVTVSMQFDYAPSILAFNDAKKLSRFEMRFGYEVIDQTHVYLGYRDFETKLENSSTIHVDNGWMLGVEFPL